jgi:competence protein ComEC
MLDVDVYQVSHHGSHNGTSVELIDAMKPKMAAISMGPAGRIAPWTAHAFGHPRKGVIDALMAGVTDTRPERSVKVALRAESKHTRPAGAPAPGPQFKTITMKKAIYGTGWDGAVVVNVSSDGVLKVDTEK